MKKLILYCLLLPLGLLAQKPLEQVKLAMIARPLPNKIMLRWSPTDTKSWQAINKYGVGIRRILIERRGITVFNHTKISLTPSTFKPLPLASFVSRADSNNYMAVAGQCLYGPSEVGKVANAALLSVQKEEEANQRYIFAMLAADFSPEAAKAMALMFSDTTAKADERYLYEVFVNVPSHVMLTDTARVLVGCKEYKPLSPPLDMKISFKDSTTTLKWDRQSAAQTYTGYFIERSLMPYKGFVRINQEPFVETNPEGTIAPTYIQYSEKLKVLNKKYYYRVRGITPFGELSNPSETKEIFALMQLPTAAYNIRAYPVQNKSVQLVWTFPDSLNQYLQHFEILRSSTIDSIYLPVGNKLAPQVRSFMDSEPLFSNYYKILAQDRFNNKVLSNPIFVQIIDTIPPHIPSGLAGKASKEGIVSLSWSANSDIDILGYRVFKGNTTSEEFSQITHSTENLLEFKDTLNIKKLEKEVFYKIIAVDKNYNTSEFSEILKVKRPDITPPKPPYFVSFVPSDSMVVLNWKNSSSDDVVKNLLYRASPNDTTRTLLLAIEPYKQITRFEDRTVSNKTTHFYTLVAQDDAGLLSEPSTQVEAKRIDLGIRPAIKKIKTKYEVEKKELVFTWDYNEPDVERILIYRKKDTEKYYQYKSLEGNPLLFKDENLTEPEKYSYKLKALFKTGEMSSLSIEIRSPK